MLPRRIHSILAAHPWKEEETEVSIHFMDHWRTCYLESRRAYGRSLYTACVYATHDHYCYEWAPADEARASLTWALGRFRRDPGYFRKKDRVFAALSEQIRTRTDSLRRVDPGTLSDAALARLLRRLAVLGRSQYGYALLPEGIDTLTEEDYRTLLPDVPAGQRANVIRVLSTPDSLGVVERERLALLRLALQVREDRGLTRAVVRGSIAAVAPFPQLLGALQRHTREFYWIQNSFRRAVNLDEDYFLRSLAELVSTRSRATLRREIRALSNRKRTVAQARRNLARSHPLTRDASVFFRLVRYFATLQDRRKTNVQRLGYAIDRILTEAARRNHRTRSEVDDYFIEEVIRLLTRGRRVPRRELRRRRTFVFFETLRGTRIRHDILYGRDARSLMEFFSRTKTALAVGATLRGFVASTGRSGASVVGTVRIVRDPLHDTFRPGEILVTGMTRPEFVPIMKRARGIITNEGGITTHAAIISRELKIPCIIGTKVATDVLRTGDRVRLDLRHGTVAVTERVRNAKSRVPGFRSRS